MPTKFREPTKINMKEEAKGPVVKKSSASAAVKKPEPAAATATAPSSTKRDMPELLSEQADLLFLELIKERLQNGREVQYALQLVKIKTHIASIYNQSDKLGKDLVGVSFVARAGKETKGAGMVVETSCIADRRQHSLGLNFCNASGRGPSFAGSQKCCFPFNH